MREEVEEDDCVEVRLKEEGDYCDEPKGRRRGKKDKKPKEREGPKLIKEALASRESWLSFSDKGLNDEDLGLLAEALCQPDCKVEYLYLEYNKDITDSGVETLAGALAFNNTLRTISLNSIPNITDKGVIALAEALRPECDNPNTSVRAVEFSRCGGITTEGAIAFAQGRTENTNLELHISDNPKIGIEAVVALMTTGYVDDIRLGGIPFGDEGALVLAEAIRNNSAKTGRLIMGGNKITDKGMIALAEAFKSNTHIWCWIARDLFSDASLTVLGETLKHSKGLTHIFFTGEGLGFGDAGMIAIAQGLTENNYVDQVELDSKGFGDEALKAFGETLKHNKKVKRLQFGFSNPKITEEGIKAIAQALPFNSALESLSIPNCDDGGALALVFKATHPSDKSISLLPA